LRIKTKSSLSNIIIKLGGINSTAELMSYPHENNREEYLIDKRKKEGEKRKKPIRNNN